jgi:hypothetical protein
MIEKTNIQRGYAMALEITRLEQTDRGTLGVLLVDEKLVCWTLELPWKDNERNVSCIPTGEYTISYEWSNKYEMKLWELKGVENRSEVKIHKGNYLSDILGCILVGTDIGYDKNGDRAVWNSNKAFNKFMAAMHDRVVDKCLIRGV